MPRKPLKLKKRRRDSLAYRMVRVWCEQGMDAFMALEPDRPKGNDGRELPLSEENKARQEAWVTVYFLWSTTDWDQFFIDNPELQDQRKRVWRAC